MVSIKWCLKQKNGIEIVEPNSNMADSYIKMAEESITALNAVKQIRMWTAVTSYYIFYQSLYALMLKIGVKCEIHSCSLEFMKLFLTEFYSKDDIDAIKKAFDARNDLQYYADRPVDDRIIEETSKHCKKFYIKTKDTITKITEAQILAIRDKLKNAQD
jgi:uncharacterized protein (UPF0332 family)